jgi:hypothetical protein
MSFGYNKKQLSEIYTHKFTCVIPFYVDNSGIPIMIPYPFPNNQVFISTSFPNGPVYQFNLPKILPKEVRNKFVRYTSQVMVQLVEI